MKEARVKIQALASEYIDSWAKSQHVDIDSETIARRLERSCYNTAIANVTGRNHYPPNLASPELFDEYGNLTYKILSHLDVAPVTTTPTQPRVVCDDFLRGLANKTIDPSTCAGMSASEMCPSALEQVENEAAARKKAKFETKVSAFRSCPKCKQKQVSKVEYQSRSADEMSTVAFNCHYCGHVWR